MMNYSLAPRTRKIGWNHSSETVFLLLLIRFRRPPSELWTGSIPSPFFVPQSSSDSKVWRRFLLSRRIRCLRWGRHTSSAWQIWPPLTFWSRFALRWGSFAPRSWWIIPAIRSLPQTSPLHPNSLLIFSLECAPDNFGRICTSSAVSQLLGTWWSGQRLHRSPRLSWYSCACQRIYWCSFRASHPPYSPRSFGALRSELPISFRPFFAARLRQGEAPRPGD